MAFRVRDAHVAYNRAIEQGAEPVDIPTGPMELRLPAIKGIGGATVYLIDRYDDGSSIYDIDFEYLEGVERHPEGCGFTVIDHLTHNVYRGRMDYWANFYESLFNFREIRYFDIKGEYTGLPSKAMTAPDGMIRIPLNEEASKGTGQIEEFLMAYNGEGIQHIALSCDNLFECWDRLKERGMPFMTAPPEAYYEMLEERLPGHGEPVKELQSRGILLDGSTENGEPRLLLQIFSELMIGPVFFEFIQRKKDEGFGEGNFTALFESIEGKRGFPKVKPPFPTTHGLFGLPGCVVHDISVGEINNKGSSVAEFAFDMNHAPVGLDQLPGDADARWYPGQVLRGKPVGFQNFGIIHLYLTTGVIGGETQHQ